ncbi:MAG: hypothetical protein ACR2NN_01800 [Bryobacteraceae bacterium]
MPDAPELKAFRELLANELENAKPGNKELIINPATVNEITLVDVTNVLPARFIRDLEFLRTRYDGRVSSKNAALELHSEGDGSQFPDLYVRSIGPKDVLPYMMIAKAMNILRIMDDPETGNEGLHLVSKNQRGRETALRLAATFAEAVEKADGSLLDILETEISAALSTQYLHKSRRDEVLNGVQAQVEEVINRVKSLNNKTYLAYVAAADKADEIVSGKQVGQSHASALR